MKEEGASCTEIAFVKDYCIKIPFVKAEGGYYTEIAIVKDFCTEIAFVKDYCTKIPFVKRNERFCFHKRNFGAQPLLWIHKRNFGAQPLGYYAISVLQTMAHFFFSINDRFISVIMPDVPVLKSIRIIKSSLWK